MDDFGNTGLVYTYSTATKVENDEGDVSITSWGTAASVKVVDGDNAREILSATSQGLETLGDDFKLVRDDVAIVTNDLIVIDSVNFKVVGVAPVMSQDVTIIIQLQVARATSITQW